MSITVKLTIFLTLLLMRQTECSLNLGTCTLSCNEKEQGTPGSSCHCSRYDEQQSKLEEMKQTMERMEERVHLLSSGWMGASNGLFYRYFHEQVNYATAQSRCEGHGSRLAAAGLRTSSMTAEIRKFLPNPLKNTWIGLDDLTQQGVYVWSDGVTSAKNNTDWHPSQPNQSNGRCAAIWAAFDGQIADEPCSRKFDFICEFDP